MSDISLKEYLAKLETLLKEDADDEAIQHCRHILRKFPKNAAVYRILGRALVHRSRWDEAREVFRRVLSVFPGDYAAHRGLSQVYLEAKKFPEALWHMERAFEQDPNNERLIDSLRKVYFQVHQVEYTKVQLTAGAVAQQYSHSGMYDQSIEVLRQALQKTPNRVDLRVLLAQALWLTDRHIEAAEASLDVLQTLPNCLEANRILTMLWLSEDRPSDAQRYLTRIEAVDPYLAFELATGGPAPADRFTLEELDYTRIAQRELTSARPDWLQAIQDDDSSSDASAPTAAPAADDEPLPDFDDLFGDSETAEPSVAESAQPTADDLENLFGESAAAAPVTSDDSLPDLDDLFGESESAASTAPADELPNLDDLFGETPAAAPATPDDDIPNLDDLFGDSAADSPAEADDWMSQIEDMQEKGNASTLMTKPGAAPSDIPIDESLDVFEPQSTDWFADFDAIEADESTDPAIPVKKTKTGLTGLLSILGTPEAETPAEPAAEIVPESSSDLFGDAQTDDSLSWLDDSSAQALDEVVEAAQANTQGLDPNSPLAWMQSSGVELVEDIEPAVPDDPYEVEDDIAITDPSAANPLAWLENSGVEITDDALKARNFDVAEDAPGAEPEAEADPLAWLKDSGVTLEDEPPAVAPPAAQPEVSVDDAAQPEASEWLADESLLDELLHLESLTTGESPAVDESLLEDQPTPAAVDFGNMDSALSDQEQAADWQDTMPDKNDNLPADWLSSEQPDDQPEEADASLAGLEWLDADLLKDESPEPSEPRASNSGLQKDMGASSDFDWGADAAELESSGSPVPDLFDSELPEAADSDTPDWLSQASAAPDQPQSEESLYEVAPAEPVSDDAPDWLAHVGSLADEPSSDSAPDWVSDMETSADVPAESQPPAAISEPSSSEFDWSAELEDAPAEPAAQPDWLSQMDVGDAEPVSETELTEDFEPSGEQDWLSQMAPVEASDEEEFPAEPAAPVPADAPDWLSQMAPVEASDEEDFPAEPAAPVPADAPDWLSQMEPSDDVLSIASAEPVPADAPDWLSQVNISGEASADEDDFSAAEPVAADAPDWLSQADEIETEAEEWEQAEPLEAVAEDAPDWLSQTASLQTTTEDSGMEWEEKEADQPVMADTPDWLSQAGTPASDQDEDAGYTWEEEEEAAPVASDTDWLAQVGSLAQSTKEEPASDTDHLPADAPDWLTQIETPVDTEQPAEEWDEAEPVTTAPPDWLGEVQPELMADDNEQPDFDDERSLDWMSGEEEEAAPIAAEMPSWLSGAQPEAAIDTDEDNWLDGADEEEEAQPVAQSDWTRGIGTSSTEPEEESAEQPAAEYGWLDEMETPDEEPEPVLAAAASLPGDADEDFASEELELAQADNAPDWLNAMVPGLDVDYEASEDAPIEQEYAEGVAHRARTATSESAAVDTPSAPAHDYDWVTTIVEQEARPAVAPAAVVAPPPSVPEVPVIRKRRFVFSRLPLWLRPSTDRTTTAAPVAPAVPPAPAAASAPKPTAQPKEELPPWLNFENDQPANDDNDDFDLPDDWLK